jgi:hypothetical protein
MRHSLANQLFNVESVLSKPLWKLSWPVMVEDFCKTAEPLVLGHLAIEAPKKTGAGASSFFAKRDIGFEDFTIEFRTSLLYMGFMKVGTKPHTIEAVNASALHFFASDGTEVFTQHVDHPGTKPNPYPTRARDKAKDALAEAWSRAAVLSIR